MASNSLDLSLPFEPPNASVTPGRFGRYLKAWLCTCKNVIFLAPLTSMQVCIPSPLLEEIAGIPLIEEDRSEQWVNLGVSPMFTQDIRWVLGSRDVVECHHS